MILDSPPLARRDNPFLGLAYYSRNDADRFSGRDGEIEAVTNGILRTRTFVVYGRSGLGKTSLLQAGVFPRLLQEERNCLPIYVRTLEDPLLDLRRALVTQGKLDSHDPESSDLAQLIECAGRDEQGGRDRLLVLVFDQFEEFFVRFADQPEPSGGLRQEEEVDRATRQRRVEQRIAFIEEMGRLAAASDLNLRLVFSLREDWIAEIDDFARAIPEITRNTYRLLPLTPFGVRQTVAATLRRAGIDFDAGLISALVEALAEVSFDPAVLQVMGSELWDRAKKRSGEGPVRLEVKDLQDVGDVKKVFQGFLDQVSREIPEGELRRKIQTRAVLEALTTEKRTKKALSHEALLEQYFAITPEELDKILERLYHHRLVRLDPRGESRWFELVHERLVELILRWLDSDLDFFKFRAARNLVRNSCSNAGWQQNPELLLNQGQLDGTVGPFKDLLLFNEEERLFLVSSAVYRQSRELSFWAKVAGYNVSADLLDHFLDQQDNEEVRQRGVEAASRFGESAQHFAERCLEIALHDPIEAVRRSAARSFADLASPGDFQRLGVALAGKAERKPAIEALVEILDKERLPKGVKFGFFRIRQARKKLLKRRLSASREAIQERGIQGTVTGLRAGLIWMATAGLFMLLTALLEIFPEKGIGEPSSFLLFGTIGFFVAPLFGALVGFVASRRCAHEALRTGREGRLVPALVIGGVGKLCLSICLLWVIVWGLLFSQNTDLKNVLEMLPVSVICSCVPLGVFLGPALIARWAWPGIWPSRRKYEPWILAWLWSLGGSLLLPLAAWLQPGLKTIIDLAYRNPEANVRALALQSASIGILVFLCTMASFGGLVSFAGLMALARTFPRPDQIKFQPLGKLPDEPTLINRHLCRGAGLILLCTTGLSWVVAFRLDGLPFFSHRWSPQIARHVQFGAGAVDTYHLVWQFPMIKKGVPKGAAPRLVKILFPADWRGYIWARGEIKPNQVFSLKPGESQRMALQAKPFEATHEGELRFDVDQDVGRIDEKGERPQLGVVRLNRKGNAWFGQLPTLPSSMAFFPSPTLQGGAWCRDMRLVLRGLTSEDAEPLQASCYSGEQRDANWKVTFDARPFYSRHPPIVEAWKSAVVLEAASSRPGNLSQDGTLLASVSDDGRSVYLRSVANPGEPMTTLRAPRPLKDIALSPDGRRILMIFKKGGAQTWERGGVTHALPLLDSMEINSADFSLDGSRVWGTLEDGTAFVWKSGEKISFLNISPDRSRFLLSEQDRRHEIVAEYLRRKMNIYAGHQLIASGDASRLVYVSLDVVRLWKEGHLVDLDHARRSTFINAVIDPKGDHLAVVEFNGRPSAKILNLSIKGESWELPPQEDIVSVAFSPTGDRLATTASDGLIKVWKVGSHDLPVVLEDSQGKGSLSFSPDGKRLVKITDEFSRVWKTTDGALPVLLPFGTKEIVSISLGKNDRFFVLDKDGLVRAWERLLPPSDATDLFLFLQIRKRPKNIAKPGQPGAAGQVPG